MNKEESKKQFGKNLKRLRTEKGLSQEELAHALGFKNRSSINKIEIGRSNIPTDKIQKTAEVLGISPLALFKADDDIEALINELPVLDEEDLDALHAVTSAYKSAPPALEEYTRSRGVIKKNQPEYASPNDIIYPNNKLLETYKKLSPNSQDELEKYAEFLLAKEKNK